MKATPDQHARVRASRLLMAALTIFTSVALAAQNTPFAAPVASPPANGTTGVARMVLSLLLVLALLFGGAWLLKRLSGLAGGASQRIRVLSQVSLGARERAVLIEVNGRELLLGVAPGSVRTLLLGGVTDDPAVAIDPLTAAVTSGADTVAPAAGGLKSTFSEILRRSLGR